MCPGTQIINIKAPHAAYEKPCGRVIHGGCPRSAIVVEVASFLIAMGKVEFYHFISEVMLGDKEAMAVVGEGLAVECKGGIVQGRSESFDLARVR